MSKANLRHDLHTLIDRIVDAIEKGADEEWVDQHDSPLGRTRHTTLVRTGKLKGVKDGRRIMVRRADIDAYLARRSVIKVDEKADEDREVHRIIAEMSRKKSA